MMGDINGLDISAFFDNDFCKFASYDTLRSLANYVDGLKISARKAMWVVLNSSDFKRIKVSQLASEVAKTTNYLHGEGSMCSVITNLAKNYPGSNNLNLLIPEGNFGCRFDDASAAPRYIFVGKEKILASIFNLDDNKIIEEQYFEGDKIEPKFLLPTIPLLLINGSDGIGTGFRQIILSRNPKDIIQVIEDIINNKEIDYQNEKITPWYKGFEGNIVLNEEGSYEIYGIAEYQTSTIVLVTELPIGYTLNSYVDDLDDLKDKGVIKTYTDLSENDKFKFEIKMANSKKVENIELLKKLKLVKRTTEIFTCIDENNQVVEFENEFDIIKAFLNVKLEYTEKRKQYLLKKYMDDLIVIKNKCKFIRSLQDEVIIINKKSTEEVEKQLEDNKFDRINSSYAYLLDMKIHSLTQDKYLELKNKFNTLSEIYKDLKNSSKEVLYLKELETLKKVL